jgi:hypothetical protein
MISFMPKSVSAWREEMDWEKHQQLPYVVVDPNDPNGLLYLTEKEYLLMARTVIRQGDKLTLVARPETEKPEPSSPAPSSDSKGSKR